IMPKLARIAVLSNPGNPGVILGLQETRTAAKALDLDVYSVDVHEPGELDRALSIAIRANPDALVLPADSMINNGRARIAQFAMEHRLPSISTFAEFAEAGGLLAYGASISDIHRR